MIKIGIAREYKIPFDSRSPLTPKQSKKLDDLKEFSVCIENSKIRCFSDNEFLRKGVNPKNGEIMPEFFGSEDK